MSCVQLCTAIQLGILAAAGALATEMASAARGLPPSDTVCSRLMAPGAGGLAQPRERHARAATAGAVQRTKRQSKESVLIVSFIAFVRFLLPFQPASTPRLAWLARRRSSTRRTRGNGRCPARRSCKRWQRRRRSGNSYGNMMNDTSNPNGNLAAEMGVNPNNAPDFLTKDYRAVMKAIDKQQGK